MLADTNTLLEIYCNSSVFGNSEIMRIFNCSESTAKRKKLQVLKAQKKAGVTVYSKHVVNPKLAYKVWGLDISDLERRSKKYVELKNRGVFSQTG